MMHVRLLGIDLAKPSHPLAEIAKAESRDETSERVVIFDVFFECDLGAGKQTHRHFRFAGGGKPASGRVVESLGRQFVSDLGGSGRYVVQTIVAHGRLSSAANSRIGCPSTWPSTSKDGGELVSAGRTAFKTI